MLIFWLYRFCVGGSGVRMGLEMPFHALTNSYRVDLRRQGDGKIVILARAGIVEVGGGADDVADAGQAGRIDGLPEAEKDEAGLGDAPSR